MVIVFYEKDSVLNKYVLACVYTHTHTQRGVLVVNILTTNSLICIYHR